VRDGQGEFQSSERGGGLEVVSLLLSSLVQCFVSLLLGLVGTCMFVLCHCCWVWLEVSLFCVAAAGFGWNLYVYRR
jgi:hypothetical protein